MGLFIIQSVIIGLGLSILAIISTYLISHTRFFREAYIVFEKYRLPKGVKGKGELRKIKKLSGLVKRARKRIILLFFIHLSIFLITYVTAIVLTGITVPEDKQLVEIPIAIPLFSAKTSEGYITHILFITFIAYLIPNYFIVKAARPVSKDSSS